MLFNFKEELEKIKLYDQYTHDHCLRVGRLSYDLMLNLTGDKDKSRLVGIAGNLHDIGKIYLDVDILNKTDRLTDEEMHHIEKHPIYGYNHIKTLNNKLLCQVIDGIHLHHERYDGTGYPNGLKKDEIPVCARVVAICDCIDALKTVRPYKEAWATDKITDYLTQNSGILFDPELVEICTSDITY